MGAVEIGSQICKPLVAGSIPAAGTTHKKARRSGLLFEANSLERLDVRRLQAFRPLLHFELDLLAFFERLEAAHLDRGVMREQIFAALGRGDEAEAFGVVEPLNSACCHFSTSFDVPRRFRA